MVAVMPHQEIVEHHLVPKPDNGEKSWQYQNKRIV